MPPHTPRTEIMPGIDLVPNSLGGLDVRRSGTLLGWIHDAGNGQWNAYLPAGMLGGYLAGRFPQLEAVRVIVNARVR